MVTRRSGARMRGLAGEDSPLDEARCGELATLAASGDPQAWPLLVNQIWPALLRVIAKNRAMRPWRSSDDDVRNVATNVLSKLGGDDLHGLRRYAGWREEHPGQTFKDWLFIVAANAARDYARSRRAQATADTLDALPSVNRFLNEFLTSPTIERSGVRPPVTAAQTAREVMEFAKARLRADQLSALGRWMEGADPEDISAELGLASADDARRLVRSAVAILRREFAGEGRNHQGA